ncbi:MAG TPA: hypothetical protein PKN24_15250, partial [bacterium]|nr:hypothetical protein [bacterium]
AFGEPYPIDPGENFHLGWGGSLLLSSVSFLLPAELRIEMRNLLFTDRGDAPAPKSRKRLVDQPNSGTVPGWVKIIAKED